MRLIIFMISCISYAFTQCAGTQTYTLTPAPLDNMYDPGQVVTLCYTLNSFTQNDFNYFEGFDLNLGSGWATASPLTSPTNCGGNATGGRWLWKTTTTSVATPTKTVGPGYFFDLYSDGNPGNDFGDQNVNNCSWTFCVTLTVANICTPQSLQIQVTAGPDGLWGSYLSTACDVVTPNTIFNGTINTTAPVLGAIQHN